MKNINAKNISALYAAIVFAVGLLLVWHGLSSQTVLNLTNLSLTHPQGIDAVGVFRVLLGLGALVAAAVSYRWSSQQF